MRDVVLDELNWKEKIIVKVFKKTIIKVYHIARVRTFNELIK